MFSRFWIIFTIIILNSFPGRLPISSFSLFVGFYHVPSPAEYLSAFSLRLLCLVCPFCRFEVCDSSLLWHLLPVGGVELVACQDFLVREICVGVLVGGAVFLLSGVQ